MIFSNKAASALALTTFGQSALISSLLSPAKGDDVAGVASTKKKFELEKKHRAAGEEVVEGEEQEVVVNDATATADDVADAGRLRGARDEVLPADAPADAVVLDVGLLSRKISRKLQTCDDPNITKANQCNDLPGCKWKKGGCNFIACVAGTTNDCSACNKNQETCENAGCFWSKDSGKGTCEPVFECKGGDPLEIADSCGGYDPCVNSATNCDQACGFIDCGSCYLNYDFGVVCQGHRGNIGKGSCLGGYSTCSYGVGNIGDESCIGNQACYETQVPVIEKGACVGRFACCGATVDSIREQFDDETKTRIEAGECNGDFACCNPNDPKNVCACPQ